MLSLMWTLLLSLTLLACEAGPDPRVAEGQELFRAGELQQALALADAVVIERPEDAEGWLLKARVQDILQLSIESCASYKAAYQLAPEGFTGLTPLTVNCLRSEVPPVAGAPGAPGGTPQAPPPPKDGPSVEELLASHAARWPDDVNLHRAQLGRLVWLANIVGQGKVDDPEAMEALLVRLPDVPGDPGLALLKANTLLLLGRSDEALAVMEAGVVDAKPDWDALTLRMGLAFARIHQGRVEEGRAQLDRWLEDFMAWEGLHFGMYKPTLEFMQFTLRVRFGERYVLPELHEDRIQRAKLQGIRQEFNAPAMREAIRQLDASLERGEIQSSMRNLGRLEKALSRDEGCVVENRIIRPHLMAMIGVARGDLLTSKGDERAAQAYGDALRIFPEDPWIREKAAGAATLSGERPSR
jgi:tetratricopeptide (TPR) repeat protein